MLASAMPPFLQGLATTVMDPNVARISFGALYLCFTLFCILTPKLVSLIGPKCLRGARLGGLADRAQHAAPQVVHVPRSDPVLRPGVFLHRAA